MKKNSPHSKSGSGPVGNDGFIANKPYDVSNLSRNESRTISIPIWDADH